MTNKDEIVSASLIWGNTVAFAVLPNIAAVTSHRVGAVVQVFAMQSAHSAVEVPVALVVL